MRVLDLFAGAGGWDIAARDLGWHVDGVEIMPEAQATRAAAGFITLETRPRNADGSLHSDVRDINPRPGEYDLVIASPPCQSFSMAGNGVGRRALDAVLQVIASYVTPDHMTYAEAAAIMGDERTALVAEPLRITLACKPGFVAWEQVPAVLPVWEACAKILHRHGYSVTTGIINSEQYGVPQTRRRAVLIARRDGQTATLPAATHSRFHTRSPQRLDQGVKPWISMSEALGWGMTGRPSMTVTGGGTDTGGAEPFGNGARTSMRREMDAGHWVQRSNYSTGRGSGVTAAERGRTSRALAHPSVTVTGKPPSWTEADSDPASVVGGLRITVEEAATLQTFPANHPFRGNKGRQYLQVGNAVPPTLAHAILSTFVPTAPTVVAPPSDVTAVTGENVNDPNEPPPGDAPPRDFAAHLATLPGEALPMARIEITNEAEAGRAIRRALARGVLPDVYRRHGHVVAVDELEEMPRSRGGRHLLMSRVEPSALRRLLGDHTYTYRIKAIPKNQQEKPTDAEPDPPKFYESEALPTVQTCRDVLSARRWPGMQPLAGVTSSPILRPNGSLVQRPGYDQETAMYYAPALDVGTIPDQPPADLVDEARRFVVDDVLGDFPWVDKADKANYLALLVAPILRSMDGILLPLGAISAATAGTGKTLLAGDIFAALFGLTSRPWVPHDEELRKAVSTVLVGSTKPVVLFDNVPEWQSIASPVLSKLLTSAQWDDRSLGTFDAVDVENDRLWLTTGNSMTFGGDMPSRTVLVRLDAKMARPDLRDPAEFKIPNLQAWLTEADNAAELLRNLLILIVDWVAHDRPRGNYVMRQFTSWARAAGGFLDHHGVHGFLANGDALADVDDEMTMWLGFCHEWHEHFGNAWKTPSEVADSATQTFDPTVGAPHDPWQGRYLVDGHGRAVTAVGLGKRLGGKVGRIFGGDLHGYRVEKLTDTRTGQNRYRVIKAADVDRGEPAAPAPRQGTIWDADDDNP